MVSLKDVSLKLVYLDHSNQSLSPNQIYHIHYFEMRKAKTIFWWDMAEKRQPLSA